MNWGVALEGHEFDLADWAAALCRPFDPYVEIREMPDRRLHVLRSADLDELKTDREAHDRGIGLVDRLNGAMAVLSGSRPLRLAGIAAISEAGVTTVSVFATMNITLGRTRVSGIMVASGPDGEPLPLPPPKPSLAQVWTRTSEGNADLSDLLSHLARSDNWYDVYKAIELMAALRGGEHRLIRFLGDDGSRLKTAKATANFYRHARFPRPKSPMGFGEARDITIHAAGRVLREIVAPVP